MAKEENKLKRSEDDPRKYRNTTKTIEIETIKEEKAINYKKNLALFIVFLTLSILLFVYIIMQVVFAFLPA